MKEALSFSEFVLFIMLHFYGICIAKKALRLCDSETITYNEKQMLHIFWRKNMSSGS